METPDTLITLLGSNPLVQITSIKLLPDDKPVVYIIYSSDTRDIFSKIITWKDGKRQSLIIKGIEVPPYNPEVIKKKLNVEIVEDDLHGRIQIDTTGGTKQMMLGCFLFAQLIAGKAESLVLSYIVNNPWVLSITELSSGKTKEIPIQLKLNLKEIIQLHQPTGSSRNPPKNALLDNLSQEIASIVSTKPGAAKWKTWKDSVIRIHYNRGKIKKEKDIENRSIAFSAFPQLESLINPTKANLIVKEVKDKIGAKTSQVVCDWFNGFWLETYVSSICKRSSLKTIIEDIKVSIRNKDPFFELDMMLLVKNRIYVISISTTSDSYPGGKSRLKKKIFEVMIRARQISGWKSNFGLICLADNTQVLSEEVHDYLVDRDVEVFGRSDILNLEKRLSEWITK